RELTAIGDAGLLRFPPRQLEELLTDVESDDAPGAVLRDLDRLITRAAAVVEDRAAGEGLPDVRTEQHFQLRVALIDRRLAPIVPGHPAPEPLQEEITRRAANDATLHGRLRAC